MRRLPIRKSDGKRLFPNTPVFDPYPKYGSVIVGSTPPSDDGLEAVILYDTRNLDGSYPADVINEGTAGDVFDLELMRVGASAPYYWWAIKRYNWYTTTSGNGSYPSTWADLGGVPTAAPFFFAVHHPEGFDILDAYSEVEWYVNSDDSSDPQIGLQNAIDYFNGVDDPDGVTAAWLGDGYEMYDEFYPADFGPGAANLRSDYSNCLVAHYLDPSTRTHRFYIDDGTTLYSFEEVFVADGFIDEDATYQWLFMDDNLDGGYPAAPDNFVHVFWSLSNHDEAEFGTWVPGQPWGSVTGALLARPDAADVDAAYVRTWWEYFQ